MLPFAFQTISLQNIFFGPFLLFGSISFLAIISSYYQSELEKNKRYRIIQSKKELESVNQELTQAKKELKNLNIHLEDLVVQRTEEIEKLIEQKNELINQLGHDLKSPLGPMINLLPILIKKEHDPKKLEILKSIMRSTNYMKNLVVKTIKLAKLNSQKNEFHFKDLQLHDEITEIAESNKLLFEEKNISFYNQVPTQITVNADKLQLQELLNNLFNNAVKYTEQQGIITIKAIKNEGNVEVSISDTGIGMTKEQMEKIFDEYYKADGSRHDFDSSGLGTTICKRIVEKHGGRIWVESKGLGKGSTFYFTLPLTSSKDERKSPVEPNEYTHDHLTQKVDDIIS